MKNKSIVIVSILALVGIFFGATSFYKSNESAKIESLGKDNAPFVRSHSMRFGDNKKSVTVVEFLDPECEACAYFHGAVKALYKEYYQDIELVIRYLDNHKNSKYAVKILEASRLQNQYSQVLDVILESQGRWAKHGFEKPELIWKELAIIEGLDLTKLKKDFETIDVDEMLKIDREDAYTLKVRGTPTFFVNGKKLERLSGQSLFDLVESELYK